MNEFGGILLVGLLTLTGCAVATPVEPLVTVTAPPPSMVETLRAAHIYFGHTDAQIYQVGQLICLGLEANDSFEDLLGVLSLPGGDFNQNPGSTEPGLNREQGTTVIYAAAAEFCPEQAG